MKGQVSIEAIASVVLLLAVFVIVAVFAIQKNLDSGLLSSQVNDRISCESFARAIDSVYNSSAKMQATFSLEDDMNVFNGQILLENTYCSFLGQAENKNLHAGSVVLKKSNGVVVFEQ